MIFTLWSLRENSRVVAFTVHEPPYPPASRLERAEELLFVKDGFSWFAALLAPIWMLVNRLWLALLIYLLVVGAIAGGLTALGVAPIWITLVDIAINLMVGLEADSIRRWTLRRRGWRQIGAVSGRNTSECERRFFDSWLGETDVQDGYQSSSVWSARAAGDQRAASQADQLPPDKTGPTLRDRGVQAAAGKWRLMPREPRGGPGAGSKA